MRKTSVVSFTHKGSEDDTFTGLMIATVTTSPDGFERRMSELKEMLVELLSKGLYVNFG